MDASGIIDKKLALQRAGGNAGLAEELAKMLLEELPVHRANIRAALANNDLPKLLYHVHKLNGATNYCGVPSLQDALSGLETELKQGTPDKLDKKVFHILEEIDLVQMFMNRPDS